MEVQYTEKVDKVIYGDTTEVLKDFTALDWVELAIAALDQGGFGNSSVIQTIAAFREGVRAKNAPPA